MCHNLHTQPQKICLNFFSTISVDVHFHWVNIIFSNNNSSGHIYFMHMIFALTIFIRKLYRFRTYILIPTLAIMFDRVFKMYWENHICVCSIIGIWSLVNWFLFNILCITSHMYCIPGGDHIIYILFIEHNKYLV